jgi:hypothetical protein
VAREGGSLLSTPLVVQLDGDGEWQGWIARDDLDIPTNESLRMPSISLETQLAGDQAGRLLMARHHRYEIREYSESGRMTTRLLDGEVEMVGRSPEETRKLAERGIHLDPRSRLPRSVIEGIARSPDGEILVLAKTDEGYAIDRWLPALQELWRLPVEELDGERRLQMVSTINGLLFLPAHGSRRMVYLPWDYLRNEAEWIDLTQETTEPDES